MRRKETGDLRKREIDHHHTRLSDAQCSHYYHDISGGFKGFEYHRSMYRLHHGELSVCSVRLASQPGSERAK